MDVPHCLESIISAAARYLRNNGYDKLTVGLLVTNLSTIVNNDVELSMPTKNELMDVVSQACISSELDVLTEDEFNNFVAMVTLILDFLSRNKLFVVESLFPSIAADVETMLALPVADLNDRCVLKRMRLMEKLLDSVDGNEVGTRPFIIFASTIREIIIRVFLTGKHSLITYALSLFNIYYKLTRCSSLLEQIWLQASMKVLDDSSYVETYLIILTHLLHSSIDEDEKSKILNIPDFWIILRRCFENFGSIRKYALCVLKYAVFHIRGTFNTAHGVWTSDHPETCSCWWKTYFVIVENLDEKQSHLVLPVFGMIQDLVNSDARIDMFWILNLLQYAMMHDSRTVRIEAFLCLFQVRIVRFENRHLPLLVKIVLQATNDAALFRKMFKTDDFEKFRTRFVGWVNEFNSHKNGDTFFELLFCTLIELKWSPIPVYYLLEFIAESFIIRSRIQLETTTEFVLSVTHFHNVAVRSSVQCLFIKMLTRISECDCRTVPVFLETLNCFNENECLERDMPAWIDVCDYLKQSTNLKSAEALLLARLDNDVECSQRSSSSVLSALVRDILLLHDAFDLLGKSRIREYFLKIIGSFSSARLKPYLDTRIQDNYLQLLVRVSGIMKHVDNPFAPEMMLTLQAHCTDVLAYVVLRMLKTQDFELVDFYTYCLDEFSDSVNINTNSLENLLNETLSKLRSTFPHRDDPSIYSYSLCLLWIYSSTVSHPNMIQAKNFKMIVVEKFVDFVQTNRRRSFIMECRVHHDAQSKYSTVFWKLFAVFAKLEYERLTEYFEVSLIFDLIFEFFDVSRRENLAEMFHALRYILRNRVVLKSEELVISVMEEGWKRLTEIQTTPYYFKSLEFWIGAFFQNSVFESRICQAKLCYYTNIWLKKTVEDGGQSYRIMILVLKRLEEIDNLFVHSEVASVLVDVFCAARISRKDQRIETETVARIRSSHGDSNINRVSEFDFMYASEEMRLRSLNLLLKSTQDAETSFTTCQDIVKLLTSIDDSNKKRYFNDSLFHRTKNRKLQLLLIFENILYQQCWPSELVLVTDYERIYNFVVHSLLVEAHQPSVRYMLEWVLMRIVIHHPSNFEEKFWHSFFEASEERIGSICSFISIAFHLATVFKTETFIDKAVQSILPWTMGQHFNARLYAQTVLMKLINLNNKTKKQYEILENALISSLKRGNAVKNAVKLQEDFYFALFHPVNHFSLQVILWDLPRLSNLYCDEWIPIVLYEPFLPNCHCIPLFDLSSSWSQFSSPMWITKAVVGSRNEERNWNVRFNESQKKFIPMQHDFPDAAGISVEKRSRLIVVASLVDKAPNLGGLTRTSEIFAVSALTVDNVDIIRNKEFMYLSMTAEKHVPLIEVKEYNLFGYLKKMKEEQYCIIGAEQVTNSKRLGEFTFPLKSVIVLGNEKEGIPASLLPVLDVCVEIPQMGVIRSLNVHVSASLMIWEYTKQHLLE